MSSPMPAPKDRFEELAEQLARDHSFLIDWFTPEERQHFIDAVRQAYIDGMDEAARIAETPVRGFDLYTGACERIATAIRAASSVLREKKGK